MHRIQGQSLAELLVGIAVGAILIGGAVTAIVFSLRGGLQSRNIQIATNLSQDMIDRTAAYAEGSWRNIYDLSKGSSNTYFLVASTTGFATSTGFLSEFGEAPSGGLVGYWKLDEDNAGLAYDSSGNGHIGELTNGPVREDTNCKAGRCLKFDGTDDYVNASGFTDLGTSNQPYSFSVWVKIAAGETVGNILHMSSAADGTGWCLPPITLQSTGKIRVHSWSGGLASVDSASVLVAQQWYHVVNTWDSTNGLRVFINGSLENSGAQSTYSASGSSNYIWHAFTPSTCVGDTGSYFNGWLDEPRIYNRALSAAEIAQLYNSQVFNRYFYLTNVCRDGNDNIVTCGTEDPSTQQITVNTDWWQTGATSTVSLNRYITRGRHLILRQTDWSGGDGQTGPVTDLGTKFDDHDGVNATGTAGSLKMIGF